MSVTNNDDSHGLRDWHCPVEVLESVPDPVLFYPNASRDVETPLSLFAEHVSDFWFADIAYRSGELEVPAWRSTTYRLVGHEFRAASIRQEAIAGDRFYREEAPFILTERYEHSDTGSEVRIHRTLRRSPSAMRSETPRIGVFFLRNDHHEGSGTLWLTVSASKRPRFTKLFSEVLDRMSSGALIVTDGSKCCDWQSNCYRPFIEAARKLGGAGATRHVQDIEPFSDPWGNCFKCVGSLGLRCGTRALIWQVTKAAAGRRRADEQT